MTRSVGISSPGAICRGKHQASQVGARMDFLLRGLCDEEIRDIHGEEGARHSRVEKSDG